MRHRSKPVEVASGIKSTTQFATTTDTPNGRLADRRPRKASPHSRPAAALPAPAPQPNSTNAESPVERANSIGRLSRSDAHQALGLAEEWLATAEAAGLTDEIPNARRARSTCLRQLGRYAEAVVALDQCKAEFRAIGATREEFRCNNNYVMVLRYLGRYSDAIDLALESIEYFEACQDYSECGHQYLNLGTLYRRTGQLTEALAAYTRATELYRLASNLRDEAVTSMNRGNLLADMGEFEQAASSIEASLSIYRELGLRGDAALALMNLGRLRALRGEFGEAVGLLRESGQVYSGLKRRRDRAFVDLYLLGAYRALNLRSEARRASRNAISAFEDLTMPYELGQALLARSSILMEEGKSTHALRQSRRACDEFASIGNELWLQIARARSAEIGLRLRRGTKPEALLEEVQSSRSRLSELGAREWVALLYLTEAEIHQRLRDYGAARTALLHALDVGTEIRSDQILLRGNWALGLLPDTDPDEALNYFREAADRVERLRLHSRSTDLKASFLGDKTPLYDAALALLLTHESGEWGQAFEFIERSRARSLADTVGEKSASESTDPETARLKGKIADLRARAQTLYDRAYQPGEEGQSTVDPGAELERIEKSIARLRQDLFLVHPSVEHSPLATLEGLQATLSDEQVALVYFEARQFVHVLIATRTNATVVSDLAHLRVLGHHGRRIQFHVGKAAYGATYMRQLIEPLRAGLNDPLRALGTLLVDPLLDQIQHAKELLVFPNTAAYGLPFHAFLINDQEYVAERFAVQYAPSATVRVVNNNRRVERTGSPLLVGISDPTLPGVTREVQHLSKLLPDAVVLTDDRATMAEFRALAPHATAVHLATHGVFREDNPAYSGIKFADGWMTAADLAEICRDTSMITLSACETGMGADQGGGEIMGISQAIMGAGCQSLISSLWTADDESTVALMTDFYAKLKCGATAPHAMRLAMLAARERDDHPYFWAPFAVFGQGTLPRVHEAGHPTV